MNYIDVLAWGMEHIASNHGFKCSNSIQEEGEICIWGGCNVPTIGDVQMLCEDLQISKDCIDSSECGIDVFISQEWYDTYANTPYTPTGMELWKRYEAVIPE